MTFRKRKPGSGLVGTEAAAGYFGTNNTNNTATATVSGSPGNHTVDRRLWYILHY